MIIHLDVERLLRKLRDKNRWRDDALDTILHHLYEYELLIKSLKVNLLTGYCAYCGIAVVYAKHSPDNVIKERLRARVLKALELIQWAQRSVSVDDRRRKAYALAEQKVRDFLNDLDASRL